MKRHKRKPQRQRKPTPSPEPQTVVGETSRQRRAFLRKLRNGGIAAVVIGGGGWFGVRDVQTTMREHDLSRIGNGMPTVVQIHDPQCPTCVALQREVRDAVCEVGEAKLQFLVANIRTAKGRELADRHGVGHVTLLLLDGDGQRQRILTGPRKRDQLAGAFRDHAFRYGNKEGA